MPACWAASAGAEPRGGVVVVDGQRWNPLLQLVRSIAECLGEQLRPGRAPGRPRPAVGRGRGRGRRGPACPARRRARSPDPPGRFGPQPLGGVESQVVGAGGLGPAGPVVSPCPPAVGSGQGDLELLGRPSWQACRYVSIAAARSALVWLRSWAASRAMDKWPAGRGGSGRRRHHPGPRPRGRTVRRTACACVPVPLQQGEPEAAVQRRGARGPRAGRGECALESVLCVVELEAGEQCVAEVAEAGGQVWPFGQIVGRLVEQLDGRVEGGRVAVPVELQLVYDAEQGAQFGKLRTGRWRSPGWFGAGSSMLTGSSERRRR